jgi:hypothetical protein
MSITAEHAQALQAGEEQLQRLLARSATDADFRAKLLSDPRTAVSEFMNREMPESIDIRFVENVGTATYVLPAAIDPKAELSEKELEAVAGGLTPTFVVALYFAGGMAIGAGAYAAGDALR